jgi:acetyl-CoA carboxylase biotin carboxyl carrier protein
MAEPAAPQGGEQMADPMVARVAALVELTMRHGLAELTVEAADFRLRLRTRRRSAGGTPEPVAVAVAEPVVEESEPTRLVTAPMIGTFYVAAGPDEPPFVAIGDTIEPGQTVAIIEAMKIMNEIQSDQRGIVVEVLARNGQGVEFGQPLFRLRPSEPPAR